MQQRKNETSDEFRERQRAYHKKAWAANKHKNKDVRAATKRRHYLEFKEDYKARTRAWNIANRDKVRERHLNENHGITSADYERMFREQGGVCGICFNPQSRKGRTVLDVDHDHKTGRIRGLLCSPCNTSIGKMLDDPQRLRSAAAYLEAHLNKEKI